MAFILQFFAVLFVFNIAPALAEEDPLGMQALGAELESFATALEGGAQKHFSLLYSNHNIIQTVGVVRRDISRAVAACGMANVDLKAKLEERFAQWSSAVEPVLEEAEGFVDNMILTQDYAEKGQIESFLKRADEVRALQKEKYKKEPVTNEAACNSLYESMGATQVKMVELLQKTTVVYPRLYMEEKKKPEPSMPPQEGLDIPEDL